MLPCAKENIGYKECVENFFGECVSKEALDDLFASAVGELSQICLQLAEGQTDYTEYSFQLGLLARLLLSALLESDEGILRNL